MVSNHLVVLSTDAPDWVQTVSSEDVWQEPDNSEEPPLGIAEETGDINCYFVPSSLITSSISIVIPDIPTIVLEYLVQQDSEEEQKVAQSRYENQPDTSALQWLEVFPSHQ